MNITRANWHTSVDSDTSLFISLRMLLCVTLMRSLRQSAKAKCAGCDNLLKVALMATVGFTQVGLKRLMYG